MREGIIVVVATTIMLAGCAQPPERNFRGVPAGKWSQLTGEQRQLIVERSYEDDLSA